MIHARSRAVKLAVASMTIGFSSLASAAGLKDKAPEGLTLAGIEWRLDKYNSDDPHEAIERASRQPRVSMDPPSERGVFDGDDPLDRRSDSNPWGRSRLPDRTDRSDRDGGWGQDVGRGSTGIDPAGGTQSATIQMGARPRSIFYEQLGKNPDTLSFRTNEQHVKVTADRLETECDAGEKAPFSDSFGDGQLHCGWSGRAWVMEMKRGREFSRTDRYELAKDGKTLKYTTTAQADGMPRIRIVRSYTSAPARQ